MEADEDPQLDAGGRTRDLRIIPAEHVGDLVGIGADPEPHRPLPSGLSHSVPARSIPCADRNRVELTEDEAQAIVAHDGIYPVSGGVNNLDYHHKECRLQMIVHFADKWSAAVDEDGRQ